MEPVQGEPTKSVRAWQKPLYQLVGCDFVVLDSCSSKAFLYQNLEGVILYHKLDKMQCSYSLGVKAADGVSISKCLHFDPNSSGSVVWNQVRLYPTFSVSSVILSHHS